MFKLFEYKAKIAKPETIYVDTSGIADNPPKFIDVLQNKTINFVIDGHKVVIHQVGIGEGMTIVTKIASLYKTLSELTDKVPANRIEQVKLNIAKASTYKQIVLQIYKLSKSFVSNKRKYKKALLTEAMNNHEKVLLITEQIFDYWMYIKKLLALLGRGGSIRMTTGEGFTWNSYETDTDGTPIIKPRFGLSTN
jgi:hypothetical protein